MLVGVVMGEFGGAGGDGMVGDLGRRHMAGINRRLTGSQQRNQVRLRPLQVEGDFMVAVRGDLRDVAVPRLARVDAELVGAALHQRVPGAFYVPGGEWLAVMPFDALTQVKSQ